MPDLVLHIGLLLLGLVVLLVGGEFLVRGATNFAYSIKISPMVVGLTIVAFGTSAPELLISLKAALADGADLAMGNVIGSNICNLTLVMGVTCLFYPIFVQDNSIKVDWGMTIGSSVLLFFFANENNQIDRYEGIIFVLVLAVYTYMLIDMSRKETIEKENAAEKSGDEEEIPDVKGLKLFKEIGFFIAGCVLLKFGADWFVGGATEIAEDFHVSGGVIGLTLVALGTSLPELVASSIAAYKKNTDLALGNLLGSCIFNNLSILGITSIVKELHVDAVYVESHMLWMIGIMLVLLPMMITRRRIAGIEGVILLAIYVAYIYFVLSPTQA